MTRAPAGPGPDRPNLWTDAAHARRYLAERGTFAHHAEGYEILVEHVPPAPRRVLDLGTGDGFLLALVREARPGITGVAVDFSAEMLARARDRFGAADDVTIVEHDLDRPLPADWGSFDLVVSSYAVHHLADERKRALYGEVRGLLEPGGAFLNLEHVASPTRELHAAFLRAVGKTPEQDDPSNRLVLVETQLAWLREVGFDQVDCHWKWRELALLGGVEPA